jgi:hypothetical protein
MYSRRFHLGDRATAPGNALVLWRSCSGSGDLDASPDPVVGRRHRAPAQRLDPQLSPRRHPEGQDGQVGVGFDLGGDHRQRDPTAVGRQDLEVERRQVIHFRHAMGGGDRPSR